MHFPPRLDRPSNYMIRPTNGKTATQQLFLQFDFSPFRHEWYIWDSGLAQTGVKIINRHGACVFSFAVCSYVWLFERILFNLIFALHSNDLTRIRDLRQKQRKTADKSGLRPKRKGKIRFEIVIEFGGWEEVVLFSCLNCCTQFLFLFLIFLFDMLVWVKSFLLTF